MSYPKPIRGRPTVEIDWDLVDEHLVAGCIGTEIAGLIGICADTLYLRCEKEHNMTFSAYSQQKKSSGEALLKKKQFDKAMGFTETGDNTLLIWLGKIRLEQRESIEHVVAPETVKGFNNVMNQLEEMQKNRQNTSSQPKEEICSEVSTGKSSQDS